MTTPAHSQRLVFTKEFVRSIAARYGEKPKHSRPRLFYIATLDAGEPMRTKIEQWAANVPERVLTALRPRLQDCDQHLTACNELLAAYHLSRLGYELEYEPVIQGKTPDFAAARAGIPRFIVEVLTRNVSASAKGQEALRNELYHRMLRVPGNALVNVHFYTRREPLTSADLKTIEEGLAAWLSPRNASPRERRTIAGIEFEVWDTSQTEETISCGIMAQGATRIDLKGLQNKIRHKESKYGKLLAAKGLPYVVAVAPTFDAGLSFRCLQGIAEGPRGLFSREGSPLSAVLWIHENDGASSVQAIHNPNTAAPLPEDTFKEKPEACQ